MNNSCKACGTGKDSCQQYEQAGLCGTGEVCLGRATKDMVEFSGNVSKEAALEALEDMDDYARMSVGVNPFGPYGVLKRFIEEAK